MKLYNKQGVAFEVEGIYCKHCASPNASPEASDNENEAAIATLATKPEGVLEGAPVQVYAEAAVQAPAQAPVQVSVQAPVQASMQTTQTTKPIPVTTQPYEVTESNHTPSEMASQVEEWSRRSDLTRRTQETLPVVNAAKPIVPVKKGRVFGALLWLESVMFFKEKKRNIFMIVLSALLVGVILLTSLFSFNIYTRCPDGCRVVLLSHP